MDKPEILNGPWEADEYHFVRDANGTTIAKVNPSGAFFHDEAEALATTIASLPVLLKANELAASRLDVLATDATLRGDVKAQAEIEQWARELRSALAQALGGGE